jgi:Protein of unknown function (DUF4230)
MSNLIRQILRLVFFVVFIFGIIALWEGFRTGSWLPNLGGSAQTTHAMVLKEMQTMGKLELVKYNFKDVVEHEVVRPYLPNPKAILIVQGEAVGCIDLTRLTVGDITSEKDTLVVHLPDPELCVYKIDHSKSKVYNTEFALLEEAQLVQEAYKQAETQIQKSALDMGILEQTKQNADKILRPLLEKIANRKVVLHYRMKAVLETPK